MIELHNLDIALRIDTLYDRVAMIMVVSCTCVSINSVTVMPQSVGGVEMLQSEAVFWLASFTSSTGDHHHTIRERGLKRYIVCTGN
jgi:hypothetical protein